MKTELKNEWIALEEKYHSLLKEKVNQHNLKNTTTPLHTAISSQIIFCSDGVIIKKLNHPELNSGISFKVYSQSIAEIKTLNQLSSNLNESNHSLLPIAEYKMDEISNYNPEEIAKNDFATVLNNLVA